MHSISPGEIQPYPYPPTPTTPPYPHPSTWRSPQVRVEACTSVWINSIYPGEITTQMAPWEIALLKSAGHAAVMFNGMKVRIGVGVGVGGSGPGSAMRPSCSTA